MDRQVENTYHKKPHQSSLEHLSNINGLPIDSSSENLTDKGYERQLTDRPDKKQKYVFDYIIKDSNSNE